VWLKPEQIESRRAACYSVEADYHQQRNERIVALLADAGLRVGELVDMDVAMLPDDPGDGQGESK
jgi:integrase/recombinase XerC/integrase/recombinase XerD